MTVGQQSGKPSRASRANDAICFSRASSSRASRALSTAGPIGQPAQSGQSGKYANRAIGQARQSGKQEPYKDCGSVSPVSLLVCALCIHELEIALSDCLLCQTGQADACQIDVLPDWFQIAISQSGQSGNRAKTCQIAVRRPV